MVPLEDSKAGATSLGASPRGAPVFGSLIHASPARIPAESLRVFGVEAEFGFSFARDLPSRSAAYSESEVLDAVGAVHAAIEIVESRFADWKGPDELSKLADTGGNAGVVFGPGYADWRNVDFAHAAVCLAIDGTEAARAPGANKGLHPLANIAWLANTYAPRYGGIRRGHVVLTGSCTGITIAHPGVTVVVDFGSLGQAMVIFDA